jgi:putative methyltransferase (TIGR04325 family)
MDGDTDKSRNFRHIIVDAIRAIRVAQIRAFARVLVLVGKSRWGRNFIRGARETALIGPTVRWLLAFHGTFSSIENANECAAHYVPASHEHPGQLSLHAEFAEVTRESDYPVLFFLSPVAPELRSVFDLGGSIGNLFFQLDRHLHFSEELVWTVHDLPVKRAAMVQFAETKGEKRLSFTDEFSSASGVDLFIVAGAIHFFEPKLSELLSQLDSLPKHVIVNRSPFSSGEDLVAVHDGGLWVNPYKLHSVEKLCSGMRDLGYDLIANWPVNERRVQIPLFPEYNQTYFGFYFRLSCPRGPGNGRPSRNYEGRPR